MAMMQVCGPVLCPNCPTWKNKYGKIVGEYLECSDDNYSGCGEDMANCPKCGKGYAISYQIKAVTPEPSWDIDLAEEEDYLKKSYELEILEQEQKTEKLKKDFEKKYGKK